MSKTIPRGVVPGHNITIPNTGHDIPPVMCKGNTTKTDLIININDDAKYHVPGTDYLYERGELGSPFNLKIELELK